MDSLENCCTINNGIMVKKNENDNVSFYWCTYWNGLFSFAHMHGPMTDYIFSLVKHRTDIIVNIQRKDGNINARLIETKAPNEMINKKIIYGTLGQNDWDPSANYLYLPLDDDFFTKGLTNCLNYSRFKPWANRENLGIWRGDFTNRPGSEYDIRERFVQKTFGYPGLNVGFVGDRTYGRDIPKEYYADKLDYTEYYNSKICFIIDGAVIASHQMAGFAFGCVPILITNAVCWFTPFLKPYENYIPVKYDLSDLVEVLEWVQNNDDKAEQISLAAMDFSKTVFSSEFQKEYLEKELQKF